MSALALSQPSGQLALQIADFMARPIQYLSPEVLAVHLSDVAGHDLRAFLKAPALRVGLETYIGEVSGAAKASLDDDLLGRIDTHAPTQKALSFAFRPLPALEMARLFLVAAVFQNTIRGALLKSQRDAIAMLLGVESTQFATRRAPMFYPKLATLETGDLSLTQPDQPEFSAHPVAEFAFGILVTALGSIAPIAGEILGIRTSGNAAPIGAPHVSAEAVAEIFALLEGETSA